MTYKRLLAAAKSRFGLPPPFVCSVVMGVDLKVRMGTFLSQPDKDEAWTYALISQCSKFIDVGCNVGEMSLIACLADARRQVVAIDANPQALATAAENLILNGFSKQARFVLAFIGETEDEEIDFYTMGTGRAGSRFRSHAKTANAAGNSFKVKTTTLDNLAREVNFAPDLIKVDVEGAEAEALAGTKTVTRKHQPRFIVEMHATQELPMRENGARVLSWCGEVDYDAYYLMTHQLLTTPDVFAERGRCHLYLQPKGCEYPAYLKELEQNDSLMKAHQVMQKYEKGTKGNARAPVALGVSFAAKRHGRR